nr:MAG: hypothetical protein 3 [Leviviridae sp.]
MKRLMSLWRELALECASWCGTSALLDIQKVEKRVESEGESFLTITLPKYCSAFERALELGSVDSSLFSDFQMKGGLPLFLRGFLSQVFDTHGTLLEEPNIDCIFAIRQLTLVFGKIERKCTDARTARAMKRFVEIEAELEAFDIESLEEFFPLFRKASTLLWADVFSHVENSLLETHGLADQWNSSSLDDTRGHGRAVEPMDIILGLPQVRRPIVQSVGKDKGGLLVEREFVDFATRFHLVPRHGPGATADRLRGNSKYTISKWPLRLESVFPYGDYAIPSWRHYDQLDRVQFLEPGAEIPVKVIPVPKTLKTPRIIAIEPTAMQYAQQALFHQFIDGIEHGDELPMSNGRKKCDLGRFFIGFADQEPNRFLAAKGSQNGCLATLDLSEASDRVLNEHVLLLFERFPQLSEAIQAMRSRKARVPGYGVITLSKFASMGSALCFPVEAMVFTTIVFTAIAYERRVPMDRALIMSMHGKVRIYGDDIIVPVEYVQCVMKFLELFGLKVNKSKSFWNGKFRESCGGDYYDGEWVTPIRLRHDLPRSRTDVDGVVGLVAFRNLLYWNGFWRTAAKLDDRIRDLFDGHYPIVEATSAALGRESVFRASGDWFDPDRHEVRVKAWIPRYRIPKSKTSGQGALLKFFLKRGLIPTQDENHLERQGRPELARIILRGTRPY